MRHRYFLPLYAALAGVAFGAGSQEVAPTDPAAMDFEQARRKANQDEARLDGDQLAELSQRQSGAMRPLIARCTRGVPSRELTPVGLVLQLDARGRVVRTWQDVQTPVADCLAAAVKAAVFYVPSKVPFLTATDLHWSR